MARTHHFLRVPNYLRPHAAGATYFFTVVVESRRPLLTDHGVRAALRRAIADVRATHPFEIDAWVLLPDHLHCIWTLPASDHDFSARWAILKRQVSRVWESDHGPAAHCRQSHRKRGEFGVWQRRYWEHRIRDEADLARHVDYVHWNPVKHGHVARVADWPYSTFHRYAARGDYPLDWGGTAFQSAADMGE